MKAVEIKQKIEANLQVAQLDIKELRVQPDTFSGWNIAVVSSGFKNRSISERRTLALNGLEQLAIEWLDLLTPEEQEWADSLPIDATALEHLPFWPEALARSEAEQQSIRLPSDLDEDLEKPIIATFYSLRGGVGRSTALAYTARILARRGHTVLCIDMDLEAPGLTALFGREADIREGQGVLPLLIQLDQGQVPNIQEHLLRLSETDELYCIPAGKPDANYARMLNLLAPEAWYREERNPLRHLMDMLGHELTFVPDIILLDARTGITTLNAPLLFDLSDIAIIVFFPHPQTRTGTEALVKALLASKTRRSELDLTPEPRFLVSPIPASKASEVIEKYQHRSLEWVNHWLSTLDGSRSGGTQILESDVTHFIPYREAVATSDSVSSDRETWQDYEPVAEWLEQFFPTPREKVVVSPNLADVKNIILEELRFSAGTAESQDDFLDTFISTDLVNRALAPNTPLVLGRKGTGKTAIFRRIMEGSQRPSVIVMSPSPLKGNNVWVLGPDGFKAIEEEIQSSGASLVD
jgi:cellulose biosynthesis protein BcsQ